MTKRNLPLIKRLEYALEGTQSGTRRDQILGLAGRYVRSKQNNQGRFYGHLDQETLDLEINKKNPSKKDINLGIRLYEILKESINLPLASLAYTKPREYKKKLDGALSFEYQKILEVLENE